MNQPLSAEVARKSVHMALGLACLGFPWWFSSPAPVWGIAALATVVLTGIRCVPTWRSGFGARLHGVARPSYGDLLFGPAVAAVFHLSGGNAFLFCIPIGILTLADAAGAIGGTRWGRHRYGSGDGFKSIEGSLAFFLTATCCVLFPLWLGGGATFWTALWISLILGLLAMMAEGLADRGFDNLVIPLGCHFVLARLIVLDAAPLSWRFAVAVFFLVLVLTGSRWSTLSGGALLGCALLGYGCAILADFRFILPPLGVFLCHVLTTRKHRLVGSFDHRLDAVLSHAIGCLPWAIAVERNLIPANTGLAGISFAMATQLGILTMATHWRLHQTPAPLPRSLAKGWLAAALPGLLFLWPGSSTLALATGLAISASALGVLAFRNIIPATAHHPTRLWLAHGFVALLSSLPALLLSA
jgi:phytol kinase